MRPNHNKQPNFLQVKFWKSDTKLSHFLAYIIIQIPFHFCSFNSMARTWNLRGSLWIKSIFFITVPVVYPQQPNSNTSHKLLEQKHILDSKRISVISHQNSAISIRMSGIKEILLTLSMSHAHLFYQTVSQISNMKSVIWEPDLEF